MVIGGSSESRATTESHPGGQPQIAVNPNAAPCSIAGRSLTAPATPANLHRLCFSFSKQVSLL
jgi:hypothetical protein